MIQIQKMASIAPLAVLKKQYMLQTTAPLDGMWLCGFVPLATHFGFYLEQELVGFCCINDEGYLLQFFMDQQDQGQSSQHFQRILLEENSPCGQVRGAFVSTAEPHYLSLCLDHFSVFEVNALMYQRNGSLTPVPAEENALQITPVDLAQLPQAIEFAVASVGAPEEWLQGYYSNLIQRQELFAIWKSGRLIATGESRGYDEYQTEYADVGMVVAKSERGRGLATQILNQLVALNEAKGLKSICSTEKTNIAAQKAITRAGFFSNNRIVQFRHEQSRLERT